MKSRRRYIWAMVVLVAMGLNTLCADIYAPYQGLEKQVNSAVAIVVFKLYVPSPKPAKDPIEDLYDPKKHAIRGTLNPHDIEILGSLKGTLEAGTTLTASVGSFGGLTDIGKFGLRNEAVTHMGRLQKNQVYLTFMKSVDRDSSGTLHAEANNVELNLLNVISKGPYHLQEDESVEQAITRLTGLAK